MATIPKSGEFGEGRLWFERSGTTLTLGLTSSALEEIGAVESLEFPNEGDDFDKGEILATIEGSNGTVDLVAPAAGIVQEINETAKKEPEIVSDDPLEEGWLVKLEIQDTSDLKEFSAN